MKPFLAATLIAALVPAVPAGASAPADPRAPARHSEPRSHEAHETHGTHEGHRGHAHSPADRACPPAAARIRPGPHGVKERNDPSPDAVSAIESEFTKILSGLGLFQMGPTTQPIPSPPGGHPQRWPEVRVPVYFHVIHDGRTGNISRQRIERQIAGLNRAHGGSGPGADTDFTFRLAGVTRTNSGAWYRDPERYERTFKPRLRRGGAGTLNLYSADMGRDMLGWSTFPWRYQAEPKMDGVVIHPESMPGGSIRYFNRGHTATHEIGHWLGLYHTFQDGCSPTGDRVADTPPERDPTNGCPSFKDTCPGNGPDPIHNFMDYAFDTCMNQFTRGQAARMHQAWTAYRARSPRR